MLRNDILLREPHNTILLRLYRSPPTTTLFPYTTLFRSPAETDDPDPERAQHLIDAALAARPSLFEVFETLAWGPADVQGAGRLAQDLEQAGIVRAGDDGTLRIPRSVHLALRGGRVRRSHAAQRPAPEGPPLTERIRGARAAQAVERAFEALRLLGTVRSFDEDPPGVLRRG